MDKNRPKVLHVSTWQVACGIATYCENLVNVLAKAGVENSIAAIHPQDWPSFLPEDVRRWEEEIAEKAADVDLVHVQHEHGLFGYSQGYRFSVKRFGGLLKRFQKLGKPVVTTFHTDVVTNRRSGLRGKFDLIRRRMMWRKYVAQYFDPKPKSAHAIVHSMRTRHSFARHGFNPAAIHTLPHACLPPRDIAIDKADAKKQLGLPEDSHLLSIFGFLGRYKGHDLAIQALEKLPENYYLAFVGGMHPESLDEFLDRLVANMPLELANRITITGWVDRATADLYFAATDVCLAPYRSDTQLSGSGAITWALSSGCPVVASKIDAFKEVNRLGECMLMITPEKINEMAWAVQKLVNDEPARNRLIQKAREFCLSYSWESYLASVLDIYRQQCPAFSQHATQGLRLVEQRDAA